MTFAANIIEANSPAVLDYLIYPEQNPMNQSYIYNQVHAVSQTLNEIGMKFIESSKDIYNKINDSDLIRKAKAAIRSAVGISKINEFSYYETLEQVREATPFMQNYVMANPVIRELYNQQMCDGYSDVYQDVFKGTIGDSHYHYRRVMDGVVYDTKDNDGNYNWSAKLYFEDLVANDRELDIEEKSKVLATWEVMNIFIKKGVDPTNLDGGNL